MLYAVSLGVGAQLPDYVPTEGLIGWWPLDGSAADVGPNQINGVLENGVYPTTSRFGLDGQALEFQGGNWVNLGEQSGGEWNLESFSVTAWYRTFEWPNAGDYRSVFARGDTYSLFIGSGSSDFNANTSFNCSGTSQLNSLDNNSDGQWHMLAGVREMNGGFTRFYVDGVLVDEGLAEEGLNLNGSYQPLSIGRFWDGNPHFFNGGIDDVGFWNRVLSQEEISALYNASAPISGCTNTEACNYNEDAIIDDGSCYPCEIPASHCGPGTIWDAEMQLCIGDGSGDINLDGCVQLGDLLDLLAAYGDCGVEESAWQCGDPLEYQGYDYETVQIGEQCWFAENLRAENYSNGDAIASDLGNSEWEAFTEGATTVYNNDPNSFDLYGRLYNSYAVEDSRKLCPFEWKVPSDSDWMLLEMELGMTEEIASMTYHRGLNEGLQLKSSFGWFEGGNGTNVTEFSALPGGVRDDDGDFSLAGERGHWWSSTPIASSLWYRRVDFNDDRIYRWYIIQQPDALSVRCLKDSE